MNKGSLHYLLITYFPSQSVSFNPPGRCLILDYELCASRANNISLPLFVQVRGKYLTFHQAKRGRQMSKRLVVLDLVVHIHILAWRPNLFPPPLFGNITKAKVASVGFSRQDLSNIASKTLYIPTRAFMLTMYAREIRLQPKPPLI